MSSSLFISLPEVQHTAGISAVELGHLATLKSIKIFATIEAQKAKIISNGVYGNLDDMVIARRVPIIPHFALVYDNTIKKNTFGQTWLLDSVPARKKAFSEFTDPLKNPSNYAVMTSDFEQTYPYEIEDFQYYSQQYLDPSAYKKIVFDKPLSVGYGQLYIHRKDLKLLTTNRTNEQLKKELEDAYKQLAHWKNIASSNLTLPEGTNPKLLLACQLNNLPNLQNASQQEIIDYIKSTHGEQHAETTAKAIASIITKRSVGQRGRNAI